MTQPLARGGSPQGSDELREKTLPSHPENFDNPTEVVIECKEKTTYGVKDDGTYGR